MISDEKKKTKTTIIIRALFSRYFQWSFENKTKNELYTIPADGNYYNPQNSIQRYFNVISTLSLRSFIFIAKINESKTTINKICLFSHVTIINEKCLQKKRKKSLTN